MTITLQSQNNTPNIYEANSNTSGTWLRVLSDNSPFIINANDTNDQVFPQLGYLGDINGVYAVLNQRGNWILSNKTKPIWESGTAQGCDSGFALILTRDGNVALFYQWDVTDKRYPIWSTQNVTMKVNSVKQVSLSTTELLVNNDGLWLINNYTDGTVKKFKALERANNFVLISDEGDGLEKSPSQTTFKITI